MRVTVTTPQGVRALALDADGQGHWSLDGSTMPSLDGCIDVDLGFSPATNTLPLRRLASPSARSFSISAALVRFPEMDLARSDQIYRRRSTGAWHFRSGSFEAKLEVDRAFIVRRYGPGLWEAVAHTSSDAPSGEPI